jgi:hypothetical protein
MIALRSDGRWFGVLLALAACTNEPSEHGTNEPDDTEAGPTEELDAEAVEAADAGMDPGNPQEPTELAADGGAAKDAAPSAPAARDATWFDGFWEGRTSEELPLLLEIVAGGISRIEIAWATAACGSTTVATFAAPVPITNQKFARKVAGGPGNITFMLAGTLSDDDRASGTFEYMVVPNRFNPACVGSANGTFTAQRVGPPRRDDLAR